MASIGLAIVILIVAISAAVLAHELGHFLSARACGVRVERFSFGLGPELIGVHDRLGTRFSLAMIPLGGFVKFHGPVRVDSSKKSATSYGQSAGSVRLIIILAGPLFSVLFSVLVGTVEIYWFAKEVEPVVGVVKAGSPAEKAGIAVGDRILSINGVHTGTFFDVKEAIQMTQKDTLTMVVQRGAEAISVRLAPETMLFEGGAGCPMSMRIVGIEAGTTPYSPSIFDALWSSSFEMALVFYQTLYAILPSHFLGCSSLINRGMISGRSENRLLSLSKAMSYGYATANLLPVPFLDGAELLFCIAMMIRGRALRERTRDRINSLGLGVMLVSGLVLAFF